MSEVTVATVKMPEASEGVRTAILRRGAQKHLAQAIEAEVAEWNRRASAHHGRSPPTPGFPQRPFARANDHERRPLFRRGMVSGSSSFFVYLVSESTNRRYVGQPDDLAQRLVEHNTPAHNLRMVTSKQAGPCEGRPQSTTS